MNIKYVLLLISLFFFAYCNSEGKNMSLDNDVVEKLTDKKEEASIPPIQIIIEKELLYNQYTLEDEYPYKDTVRVFQWDKIKRGLLLIDSMQQKKHNWAILQNYKNVNGEAPLVREYANNVYKRIADSFGVERFQSVPLFLVNDTVLGERYGRDGTPVKYLGEEGTFLRIGTVNIEGEWLVPKKYVKIIGDTVTFNHAIFVDRRNQNITTLEKVGSKWMVRSMNPATTGLFKPPYAQDTPLGLFIIQERKSKMVYLKDGTQETGGFAPWASRFTNGAYLHGVPVNAPQTALIEYSPTLGTTPRSHMCVRNATSHAKFIYDWGPVNKTIVFIIE